MDITVKRIAKKSTYTIGRMYLNGEYFCDTLEDTDRGLNYKDSLQSIKSKKVYGNTAIPTGTYKVIVNKSPRFKRDLPRIVDVPGYEGVLIHRGNTHQDTAGCILVGLNKKVGKVINSTPYETALVNKLKECLNKGDALSITIS